MLSPADDVYHVDKTKFRVPFVCGARDLGEALRRIAEGASMIRTKGEPGTGDIVQAVRHMRMMNSQILHVTPFNSFPSHITASAERRQAYLNWAKERSAIIIEDDYDSEYSLTGAAPQTLYAQTADENVIYLNTFSKTIAPTIRAGYMLLPAALLPLYQQTVSFYSCTVPMLEQFFLAEWLDSGEFERNISRMRNRALSESKPL